MEKVLEEKEQNSNAYILQKEILSLQEACIYLCISQSHMYKLTSSRAIPHYSPTGKLIYFKRTELEQWVLKNKRSSREEIEAETLDFIKRRYK